MRGADRQQHELFSYGSLEDRVPAEHPLRAIRMMVDEALATLSPRFDELYGEEGRPSIPPERLLRALLVQMFYTIRSERLLMEQLNYNLLFRWFVGLSMDEEVWHPTVFTKNRDRLLEGDIANEFFRSVLQKARRKRLLSNEHFTVDGTLIEAWAGQKSFQRKDDSAAPSSPSDGGSRNPTVDFRQETRSNATHQSKTDPSARLYKKTKGSEAKLCYLGHLLTENRHGLVVNTRVTLATGTAEREAAVEMLDEIPGGSKRVTVGADKAYDTQDFVQDLRERQVTPHVAQNTTNRESAIDDRTTRHTGYAISQRKRKRVEEVFGWMKTIAVMRKTRHRGPERVGWTFTFAAAAYNLVRMRTLVTASAAAG
jgi:transposase